MDLDVVEIDVGVDGYKPFKASVLDMWSVTPVTRAVRNARCQNEYDGKIIYTASIVEKRTNETFH